MRPACQGAIVLPPCVSLLHDCVKVSLVSPSCIPECQMRDKMEFRDAGLRLPNHDDAYRPNGVIESRDYGIFNVFMRVSVSALRVGGYRGGEEGLRGARTDCRAYQVTTQGWDDSGASTHSACFMRRCLAGCLSHWIPVINSQGLCPGKSEADSWTCRSSMSRYSVRASCLGGALGWGRRRGLYRSFGT